MGFNFVTIAGLKDINLFIWHFMFGEKSWVDETVRIFLFRACSLEKFIFDQLILFLILTSILQPNKGRVIKKMCWWVFAWTHVTHVMDGVDRWWLMRQKITIQTSEKIEIAKRKQPSMNIVSWRFSLPESDRCHKYASTRPFLFIPMESFCRKGRVEATTSVMKLPIHYMTSG